MSWFSNLFKSPEDPSKAANQYLQQIPGAMQPYYQPYMEAGKGAMTDLQNQYGQMTSDPGALMSKLSAGYKESPGYQQALRAALQAGQNASAAGGMLGTPQDQTQAMDTASGMASKDYEAYMKHIMDLFGGGLSGEQGINKMGFDASTGYADSLGQVLGQQGQNAFAGAAGRNTARGQDWSNIFKAAGTVAPFFM